MSIYFDEQQQSFILQAKQSTYIISIIKEKYLSHLYWGSKIEHPNTSALYHTTERPCSHPNADADLLFSLDTMKAEYPSYGTGDMRMPAYQIQCPNGSRITEFLYDSYKIIDGIPPLNGLPYVYSTEAEKGQTLEIRLKDDVLQADLVLTYSVFDEYDVILRSSRFENNGNEPFTILRALSLGIDFEDNNYDVITLSGSWARERDIYRRPLTRGITAVESRRGASGHSDSPFLALVTPETTEHVGEVYGFSLVYSGNFYAGIECNQYLNPRVVMGINPFDFSWKCQPGDTFTTPEVVMTYSNAGLNGMSLNYHKLYRTHLARGKYQLAERPILINNWEATYFDFNEEKILAIAKEAQKMGIEMLVLDDGWFGKRDIDDCSLGDWYVDQKKLPQGLAHLVDGVNALGMKFGLWFEPEAISPDSDLYRAHPDWCLHVPDRKRTLARNQLILDYSRKDVCDAIVDMLSDVLSSANIEYVKWDMNRNMTEIGSALLDAEHQMETAHRYILGLYDVLERITRRFPDVLFESCAGGGGRLDAGMMYYMPQNWTSDDTDGMERLEIQYGTSLVFPQSLTTAHVSAVPNHQTGRTTSLDFRGNVAMPLNFGYELDVTKMIEEEKSAVKQQVTFYKKHRTLIQYGDFYRLLSPFEGNDTGWITVAPDQTEAIAYYYQRLTTANPPMKRMKLTGLNPDVEYIVNDSEVVSGSQLMNYGVNIPTEVFTKDFSSYRIHIIQK